MSLAIMLMKESNSKDQIVFHTSFINFGFDDSFSFFFSVALGRNQPLKKEKPKWKSDYPMTDGQLRSKRDEFWDTAPAFEGRKEIWDALKAAAHAFESSDHELAQAIIDGANITLPHGRRSSGRRGTQSTHLIAGGQGEVCVFQPGIGLLDVSVVLFLLCFMFSLPADMFIDFRGEGLERERERERETSM